MGPNFLLAPAANLLTRNPLHITGGSSVSLFVSLSMFRLSSMEPSFDLSLSFSFCSDGTSNFDLEMKLYSFFELTLILLLDFSAICEF